MFYIELKSELNTKSYPEAGAELGDCIRKAILNNDKIQIDMSGVDAIPTMFMNTSFGVVMNEFGEERVKKSMVFRNITIVQIERIKKYLNDYTEIYLKNK